MAKLIGDNGCYLALENPICRNALWELDTTLVLTVCVKAGMFEGGSSISTWPETFFRVCDELKAISQKNTGSTEFVEGDLDEIYENEIRFTALGNGCILVSGKIIDWEESSVLGMDNTCSLEFEFEVACGNFGTFIPALEAEVREAMSHIS